MHKTSIQNIPTSELSKIILPKDGPKQIVPRIEVELDEVATIESQGWNKFKAEFSNNNEEVLEYVYTRIGIPNASQKAKDDLANKNEDQWNKFMESLGDSKKAKVEKTPFAFFSVYINGSELDYYKNRIYHKGSTFSIPESASYDLPADFVTLQVSHIYDTCDILSGERETVILVVLDIKKNIEVKDK